MYTAGTKLVDVVLAPPAATTNFDNTSTHNVAAPTTAASTELDCVNAPAIILACLLRSLPTTHPRKAQK